MKDEEHFSDQLRLLATALTAISLAYRTFNLVKAQVMARKILKEIGAYVNTRKFVKENLKSKKYKVLIVSSEKDLDAIEKEMTKAGVDKLKSRVKMYHLKLTLSDVKKGNNAMVYPIKGKNYNFFVLQASERVPKAMLAHELGHIKSAIKGSSYISFDATTLQKSTAGFISLLSAAYEKRGKYSRYREEVRAWDLAGVPKDDPLRRAALDSYWQTSQFKRALIRAKVMKKVIPVAFYVLVMALRKISRKVKSMTEEDWYKYYKMSENFKSTLYENHLYERLENIKVDKKWYTVPI